MKYLLLGLIFSNIFSFNNVPMEPVSKPSTVEITQPKLVNAQKYEEIVTSNEEKYEDQYISIDLKIPVVNYENKVVEKSINDVLSNKILKMKEDLVKESKNYYEKFKDPKEFPKFEIKSLYKVTYRNENILSIIEEVYSYNGGAHGIMEKFAYNFDLNTGKYGELKDFFDEREDYRKVILDEVREQIKKEPEIYFDNVLANLNGIAFDHRFYLTDDGIVVYYDVYDIAPYSSGIREFKIPYSKFKYGLKENITIKNNPVDIKKTGSKY